MERDEGARQAEARGSDGPVEYEEHQEEVDADQSERVEQPADDPPRTAAVTEAEVRLRKRQEDLGPAAPGLRRR